MTPFSAAMHPTHVKLQSNVQTWQPADRVQYVQGHHQPTQSVFCQLLHIPLNELCKQRLADGINALRCTLVGLCHDAGAREFAIECYTGSDFCASCPNCTSCHRRSLPLLAAGNTDRYQAAPVLRPGKQNQSKQRQTEAQETQLTETGCLPAMHRLHLL